MQGDDNMKQIDVFGGILGIIINLFFKGLPRQTGA